MAARRQLPLFPALGCDPRPLAAEPLSAAEAEKMAGIFKALSDPVRLRLLSLIASRTTDTCVCELVPWFDVSEPTISHHLKVLREAGLVTSDRRESWVCYRAVPEILVALANVLDAAPAGK